MGPILLKHCVPCLWTDWLFCTLFGGRTVTAVALKRSCIKHSRNKQRIHQHHALLKSVSGARDPSADRSAAVRFRSQAAGGARPTRFMLDGARLSIPPLHLALMGNAGEHGLRPAFLTVDLFAAIRYVFPGSEARE
jgi:hypothetical protein